MADQPEAKNIDNIYYDCLERIFDFLDLKSLLMVAHTCKRLQVAAAAKFGDEHGKKKVCLRLMGGPHQEYFTNDSEILENERNIGVGRNKILPFLRCFGSKVSSLHIDHGGYPDQLTNPLSQYVNEYCADTVTSIQLSSFKKFPDGIFRKPFQNVVEVLLFAEIYLPKLLNWFPNVRRLELCSTAVDQTAVEVHFPHLEHLTVHTNPTKHLTNENAMKLLHSNKQLESVQIWSHSALTLTELSNMISKNRSISKLNVCLFIQRGNVVDLTMVELIKFAAEHPKMTDLLLYKYRISVDDVIVFLGQPNSLKNFEWIVKDRLECDHIINQLGNEWQHEISPAHDGFFIKLRR